MDGSNEVAITIEPLMHECPVCFETSSDEETVACKGKDNAGCHRFCKDCVRQHADTTLNDFTMLDPHATGLRCMETGCKNPLLLDDIAAIVPEATLSLLTNRLLEDQAALKRRLNNADQIDEDGKEEDEVADATRLIEEKLSKVFIRRCPDCRRSIVKTMGCNFVKCPCGTGLCCVCGDRHRLKCNLLCDYKASLVRDRTALKKLYDGATPAQRTHLRSIHPDIEQYGSFRYKCRDYLREHVNGIIMLIFYVFSAILLLQFHERLGVSLNTTLLILGIEGLIMSLADYCYRHLW